MAWQQYVADVGLEVDPDTGLLAYREVIVSVMRQNGKTTLVLAAECARCLLWGSEQRVAYTAQTGKDARAKFKEDHKPLIEKSPLDRFVSRFYLSDGGTSLVWKNGSRINVLDNTPSAGHGKTLDLAIIDEAFSDKDNMREQALLPTMATRVNPQIWNTSTAGTLESTYLLRKVELGRAAVTAGLTSGTAYFEWSIPDDEDVDDPDVWARRMPAYGVTINDEFIRHARQTMTDGDYRRAVGNQWTETDERLIPGEFWRQVVRHDAAADRSRAVFAIDAKPDRKYATVVAADETVVELVEVRDGINWLLDWFTEDRRGRPVAVDQYGPLGGIADALESRGVKVVRFDSTTVRKACGQFYDDIMDGRVVVRHDELVETAVKHAARRSTADSWAWHREVPGGDILMALSLGHAAAAATPEPSITLI